MKVRSGFIDSIGNTPLIKLRAASEATGCDIYGKAEFLNPGGSVKDRAALEDLAVEGGALAALVEAVTELIAADAETALVGHDMADQFGGLIGQGARRHIGSGCKKGRPQ